MGFIFGGNTGLTPEEVKRRRDIANAMRPGGQIATTIPQGLSDLAQGIVSAVMGNQADSAERSGRAGANKAMAPLMRSLLGGTAAAPAPMSGSAGSDTLAGGTGGDIAGGIRSTADALGIDPVDLATAISYETAGTFNPTKGGPTTKWGKHRGLIQFGEPQAKQFGVDWTNPVGSQLGPDGAVAKYLRSTGVKPGMGMMDIYSAINAGGVGRYNRSDANAGGAPGTVADKVNNQMAGHRQKAVALMAAQGQQPVAPPSAPMGTAMTGFPPVPPAQAPQMAPQAPTVVPASAPPPMAPQATASPQAPMNAYQRVMMQSLAKEAGGLEAPPQRAAMASVMGQGGQPSGGIMQRLFGQGGGAPQPQSAPMAAPAPMGNPNDPQTQAAMGPIAANQASMSPQQMQQGAAQELAQFPTDQLMALINEPWLNDQQRSVVDMVLKKRLEQQFPDPGAAADLQLKQLQIQKAQKELASQGIDTVVVDGALVNKQTGEVIYKGAPKEAAKPAAIQEYEYAKSQGFKGSFQDWEASKKGGMSLQMNPDGSVSFQQGGNIKPMTEAQSKDTVYATRAEGALKTFEPVANSMSELSSTMLGQIPGVGNYMKSENFQKAEQAGREFLAAVLRKDTGAAITSQEMSEYGSVYFPKPGDSADVLIQKKASRERALNAMKAGMTPQAILAQERALANGQAAPTAPTPATPPAATDTAPQQNIPPDAIQMLKADPSWEAVRDFNEIFGPGAAERILQEDANGRK